MSIISDAAAGGMVGGPVGAAIGTGLGIFGDIFGIFQGNKAINTALGQQLAGVKGAEGDITAAADTASDTLGGYNASAQDTAYAGLGGIYGQTSPYTTAGGNAAYALSNYQSPNIPLNSTSFNFDPSKVTSDPGTKFIMDQAAQTLSRSAAGRGALNSGGTQKGLADYLTNLSSTLYGQAYNRQFQNAQEQYQTQNEQNVQQFGAGQTNAANSFNRLFSLSGQGLNAANTNTSQISQFYQRMMGLDQTTADTLAQIQLQKGGNLANLSLGKGNLEAAATLGKSNNLVGGIQNIGYSLSKLLQKPSGNNTEVLNN